MKAFFKLIFAFFANLFRKPDQTQNQNKNLPVLNTLTQTKTQERDAFLSKASGYTFNSRRPSCNKPPVKVSTFKAYVLRYIRLKRAGKIVIKSYKDKYGFPAFELKKSLAEQLKTA